MKNILMLAGLLFSAFFSLAQKDYKVVFDLTSKDTVDQKTVIRWVNEVAKAEPTAQIEVVMYGQGLALATQGRSLVTDDVLRLAQNKNIAFKVCQVAMKNQGIEKAGVILR
jgi:uncharacterized protein